MTVTPLARAAAAAVMSLIAIATVLALSGVGAVRADSDTPAADLPGLAAVAPDVQTQPIPLPSDLPEGVDFSADALLDGATTGTAGPGKSDPTKPAVVPTTSAPTTSAPTTAAPEPEPKPEPKPEPAPTKKPRTLLDIILGTNK